MYILGLLSGLCLSAIIIDFIQAKQSEKKIDNIISLETKIQNRDKLLKNMEEKIVDLENNIELLVNNSKNAKIKELTSEK